MAGKLTKPEAAALERLFVASMHGLVTQIGAKVAARLVQQGLVEPKTMKLDGFPPCIIKGHALTPAGHRAYCEWASENVSEEEMDA